MRMKVTVLRKWLAALALVAMVAGGIGIAAVVITGGLSQTPTPQATPRTTLAPPPPKVPTPMEFNVDVVVTDQQCEPGGGCTYKYTIQPKYIGLHPLPDTPFTVFYEVVGGKEPQNGEFTVHKDQAQILKDVTLEGPPAAQLNANVLNVAG